MTADLYQAVTQSRQGALTLCSRGHTALRPLAAVIAHAAAVRRGTRCTAEWLAVSAELADLRTCGETANVRSCANEQMAARHSSWRGNSAMSPDAHFAQSSHGICGDRPALPVSRPLASIRGRPDPCSTGSSDRRSDDEMATANQRHYMDIHLAHHLP
jgi:hypothetical protein